MHLANDKQGIIMEAIVRHTEKMIQHTFL